MKTFRRTFPEDLSHSQCVAILSTSLLLFLLLSGLLKVDSEFLQLSGTLFGAFLGATSAFLLQSGKELRHEKKKNCSSARRALFVLANQINFLHNLKIPIDENRDSPNRFSTLEILRSKPPALSLDIESLSYILETRDSQTLNDLTRFDRNFENTLSAISERNEIFLELIRSGSNYKEVKDGKFELKNSPAEEVVLRAATDAVYVIFDQTLKDSLELVDSLRSHIKRTFPGETSIEIRINEGNC
ncbi:MAG: hypothetical protein MI807_20270 [Verrucomicrobiales bacterium]|nr:hypothetical protein [Verrucomicrobiales bacterium]